MDDTEICRLCAEAIGLRYELSEFGGYYDSEGSARTFWPLTNAEQAAQVRWKLLNLGYKIEQDFDSLRILPPDRAWTARQLCLNTLDEYHLLAETLARHQLKEEPKNE